MTELEKKLLLSKEEYETLMKHFSHADTTIPKPMIQQINYYYDTDDLLMNRQNITCRIRWKDGKHQGTIKRHFPHSDQSTETDVEVYDGNIENAFINMGLSLKGELHTERCTVLKDTACEVVLDKNKYLGHEDYELEIEYAPMFEHRAERILKTILTILHINTPPQAIPGKAKRFFAKYTLREKGGQNEPSA